MYHIACLHLIVNMHLIIIVIGLSSKLHTLCVICLLECGLSSIYTCIIYHAPQMLRGVVLLLTSSEH